MSKQADDYHLEAADHHDRPPSTMKRPRSIINWAINEKAEFHARAALEHAEQAMKAADEAVKAVASESESIRKRSAEARKMSFEALRGSQRVSRKGRAR